MQSIASLRSARLRDPSRQLVSTKVKVRQSIHCRLATTPADLRRADEFRRQRYEDVGLLGKEAPTDSPTTQLASASPVMFQEDRRWKANVFLAFRTTEYLFGVPNPRRSEGRNPFSKDAHEVICGTVTLLTPTAEAVLGSGHESVIQVFDPFACDGRVGRVCRLAIEHESADANSSTRYRSVFLALTGLMHQTAIEMGLTHMDAIVHPRHAKLYHRIFKARPIGEPFECQDVSGAPGQYMRANIAAPMRFHERLRSSYDAEPMPLRMAK
ncbi:N-acyl amino acid synthase FeeM domain-containing protein [Rhodopirellula sp. MGV]|uniref:N-acyl amino acid synthase FeeM domain-containing protein n=1 Tax=Rhodopirellula sp. MGV TaxID=2023130 RepID=UPI000B96B2E7|nr:hypothetical protein [Rhodopirellula sp. MGV]OYP31097.1 hypothetical protein CGZ80_21575 [Rhodopirellula sp. MGV]PNY37469.1 hypothetical protein C2E31_08090 [Rhodopirellula baltica]